MKKLTMPYPHAYYGVLRFSPFTLPSKVCGREVRP